MSVRGSMAVPFRQTVSSLFAPALKAAADESIASYRLMLRAGLIRKSHSGVYSMLPLGLRARDKLERVIDAELFQIGAQKLSLPLLLSSHLWEQTGRWEQTGHELFRLLDRHNKELCLAPTHEEEITNLVAMTSKSYRDLPLRLYQTGLKYRDEVRPRFGLMRAREFVMNDMYTFDTTTEAAEQTYDAVCDAYMKIFKRLDLDVRKVEADTGNIGGDRSHEFHIIADIGEDEILHCSGCGYAANRERAVSKIAAGQSDNSSLSSLLRLFNVPSSAVASGSKVVQFFDGDECVAAVVIPEGSEPNPLRVKAALSLVDEPRVGTDSNAEPNYLLLDANIALQMTGLGSDVKVGNFALAADGHTCAQCSSNQLRTARGIEVGHAFFLGEKYSSMLKAMYHGSTGATALMQMGCYGLGVSRILAGIVETHSDNKGIRWPESVAPIALCILVAVPPSNPEYARLRVAAEELYDQLSRHAPMGDIIIDDRDESTSVGDRLADANLKGYPWLVIVGREYAKSGRFELQKAGQKGEAVDPQQIIQRLRWPATVV